MSNDNNIQPDNENSASEFVDSVPSPRTSFFASNGESPERAFVDEEEFTTTTLGPNSIITSQCPNPQGQTPILANSGGVRPADGQIVMSNKVHFKNVPANLPFDTRLEYNSLNRGQSGFSLGWMNIATQELYDDSFAVFLNLGPTLNLVFLPNSSYPGGYEPCQGYTLTHKNTFDDYGVSSPTGESRIYREIDISAGYHPIRLVEIKKYGSNGYQVNIDPTDARIIDATMQVGNMRFRYVYTWDDSGAVGVINKIILEREYFRSLEWSDPEQIERLDYIYGDYDGIQAGPPIVIKRSINTLSRAVFPPVAPYPPDPPAPANWLEVEAERFSYGDGFRVRHVVTPELYKQMVNNGIDPAAIDDDHIDDLNPWAETEYGYTGDQVSTLYTHGRRYAYQLAYSKRTTAATSINAWMLKTAITYPDLSVRTLYMNWGSKTLLDMWTRPAAAGVPAKTWFTMAQRFDSSSENIKYTADAAAIDGGSFSETKDSLVDLFDHDGQIEERAWDSTSGKLQARYLRNGMLGTAIKQEEYEYQTRTTVNGTIFPISKRTIYRDDAGLDAIQTNYSYTWPSTSSLNYSSRTTSLPAVPLLENGRNIASTRVENYDDLGFLTSTVDEAGVVTKYEYDTATSRRSAVIQDYSNPATGHLNLRTDYQYDFLGRMTQELGPAHSIDIGGVPTSIRRAKWTLYNDTTDEVRAFAGYQEVTSGASHVVGPVTITLPNLPPPTPGQFTVSAPAVSYTNWRRDMTYDAVYSGTGLPTLTTSFPRSSWVRWTVSLSDQSEKLSEEWSYFVIPTLNYGAQSTNFGRKFFAYDARGRLNQTTCAGGTIDRTTYNPLGWVDMEEIGTSHGMDPTVLNTYDDRGNLTLVTVPVDTTSAHDRVTIYAYDWRSRRTQWQASVEVPYGGAEWVMYEVYSYNNLNQLTETKGYNTSTVAANLQKYTVNLWDVRGRNYRTRIYGVTSTGTYPTSYFSNSYYTETGRLARQAPGESALFSAWTYDAVGRQLKSFQAYEPSGYVSGSDPAVMTNAVVMEQQEQQWDEAANLISFTSRARFDTQTTSPVVNNGELKDPTHGPQARVSYIATYADALGRQVATANYGTYGAAAWSRSGTIPVASDTILVTLTSYSTAGNPSLQTDPIGQTTAWTYDAADRRITLVEGGTRTTHYEYTDDGWLRKLKCDNADTGQQVTEWVYGVKADEGSQLNSNRLPLFKIYPGGGSTSNRDYFGYNRQQQVIAKFGAEGTHHIYGYDKFGRLVSDTVVALAPNIDGTIYQLMTGYGKRGMLERKVSYSPTFTVLDDVYRVYNEYNQLITEYQSHDGGVNTSTAPKVQYTYAAAATGLKPRLTGIIYPNGRVVNPAYSSGIPDKISRPDNLGDTDGPVAGFRFMGLVTQVGLIYTGAANTEQTYETGSTSDAGDRYAGLDRFGRLVETLWLNSGSERVHTKYGRDRVGGLVWRHDLLAAAITNDQDVYYHYDSLQQVTQYQRGALTPAGGPYTGITAAANETIGYDRTGNWGSMQTSWNSMLQYRNHNVANQITSITGPSGVAQVAYDGTGNTVYMPSPTTWTIAHQCRWDPWNRMVEISGTIPTCKYRYDAMHRRIRTTNGSSSVKDFYFDTTWRAVEERAGSAIGSMTLSMHYIWSPFDRWTLIRRVDYNATSPLNNLWCLKDGLDPVAIVDATGTVLNRGRYDAFGNVTVMSADFGVPTSGPLNWNFFFHGEFLDQETGLYNYGYRYYHPALGRWLSRDPKGENAGINLYSFVLNSPSRLLDVLGRDAASDMVSRYFKGNGDPLDMMASGSGPELKELLRPEIEKFTQRAAKDAKDKATEIARDCDCKKGGEISANLSLKGNRVPNVNLTTRSSLGFVLGKTTLFTGYSLTVLVDCCACEYIAYGDLRYSLRDEFSDPLDIGEGASNIANSVETSPAFTIATLGIAASIASGIPRKVEVPFGTAYKINADWSEFASYSGALSPCPC